MKVYIVIERVLLNGYHPTRHPDLWRDEIINVYESKDKAYEVSMLKPMRHFVEYEVK